jgi:hypothetical protein
VVAVRIIPLASGGVILLSLAKKGIVAQPRTGKELFGDLASSINGMPLHVQLANPTKSHTRK